MKILVVDDDHDMHTLYGEALLVEDGPVTEIIGVHNGQQAVDKYREDPTFDLVIMDGTMPVMGGYDAARAILSYDADARIILMSWAPNHQLASVIGFLDSYEKRLDHDVIRDRVMMNVDCQTCEVEEEIEYDDPPVTDEELDDALIPAYNSSDEMFDALDEPDEVDTERASRIAGMRKILDVLEANPDIALPDAVKEVRFWFWEKDGALEEMKQLRRLLGGGTWDKAPWLDYFDLRGTVGGVNVKMTTARGNVCQRVVVGTRTVVEDVPDPEVVKNVPLVRVTREIEDVEWVCPESLASG